MTTRVPGDKSVTQRALIFAALAEGESRIRGLLAGEDPASTAEVLRELGASIPPLPGDGSELRMRGVGRRGLSRPTSPLDCGNSGTCARLLAGVLAGAEVEATLTGDSSLRLRPMRRVTEPLSSMGARFEELGEPGCLPIRVSGGSVHSIVHRSPVASAQVKSAILLAGLTGRVEVTVREPERSRDHTERMLRRVGFAVAEEAVDGEWRVTLDRPEGPPAPLDLTVPGDFSSAAFLVLLAVLGGAGPELVVEGVGLNPTRTGVLRGLRAMGAEVYAEDEEAGDPASEPTGTVVARPSELSGVRLGEGGLASLIDEVPLLAVAAARAEGITRIGGAGELRVKETDRIAALAENFRALGVRVEEFEDGLEVEGTDAPVRGRVRSFGDHRIAMAFGVLGALPGCEVEIDDPAVVAVSYPGFWEALRLLSTETRYARTSKGSTIVTIDGPAGSGKTTTAREVARRLGLRHLDSGALYRALTHALLEEGVPPSEWEALEESVLGEIPVEIHPDDGGFQVLLRGRPLGPELRSDAVTSHVSLAARVPAVRSRLLGLQRDAGRLGGLVAEGRDLGTVVFPEAAIKVFLVADLEERARRRFLEREGREPLPEELREEANRMEERDVMDSGRDVAPLREPVGALRIDTTRLGIDEQIGLIVDAVAPLRG